MGTTKEDIIKWFKEGAEKKKDFLIVVCDTFDHDDYPVYTKGDEDFEKQYTHYNGHNMQKIMEVYNLHKSLVSQLKDYRTFNYPEAFKEKYNL